jgi:ribosomal protein S18 acetylase RimI-like enzyme
MEECFSVTAVRLRVRHRNQARRLYERAGFFVEGSNKTHFLMVWLADEEPERA